MNLPFEHILDELDFIKTSQFIPVSCASEPEIPNNILSNKDIIRLSIKRGNEICIYLQHEYFWHKDVLDSIQNQLENENVTFKIISATTNKFKNSAHPLTSLIMWNGMTIHKYAFKDDKEILEIFSNKKFKLGEVVNDKRIYRGILSVRKETNNRNIFFDKFNPKIKNGITRYCKLPHREKKIIKNEDVFPDWESLIEEYKKSYFSFIIETKDNRCGFTEHKNYKKSTNHTSLTEKTLLSFMTGTLPIVLGGNGFVKSLEDMGLKVWNNEFGFDNADEKDDYFENGHYYFNKCIENINNMSMESIKDFWNTNKNRIQKNYDIVSSIVLPYEYRFKNLVKQLELKKSLI